MIHAVELFDRGPASRSAALLSESDGHQRRARGRGLGLGLLAENLRRFDQAGMPAYLEASNPTNVALYGRRGSGCVVRSGCPETYPRFSVCGETIPAVIGDGLKPLTIR